MNRRRRLALVALGVFLAVSLPVVAGSVLSAFEDGPRATEGVRFNAGDGPEAVLGEDVNISSGNPVVDANTVVLNTSAGNVSVSSSAPTAARLDTITGAWTRVSAIEAGNADVVINPGDKQRFAAGGDIEALDMSSVALDDGSVDFHYSGSGSSASVSVWGVASGTQVAAVDDANGTVLDVATADSNGRLAFDALPLSSHDVRLSTSSGGPVVDDASMNPGDGGRVTTGHFDLSVGVSDPDFPDDSVDVELYINGSLVATKSASSDGAVEFSATRSDGDYDWHVVATDEYGQSDTSATNTFTVKHYDPVIDDDSAGPTGGLTMESNTFTVDVSDRDFGGPDNDELTAELYVDGEKAGQDVLTSNGTAAVDTTVSEGGDHTYHWELTDDYGYTDTSRQYDIQVPDELYIYNETSDPPELVDGANATITFYFDRENRDDLVVKRNATDGAIDLNGLPADESFIAVVSADGYFNRRIFVPSLYETQRIYMLNESADAVQPTFTLTDFTGNYELDNTVLEVQRSINGSWQTVEGDYFGATNQFSAVLMFNERHRMIIHNVETGTSRNLGVFTPVDTERIAVEVHQDTDVVRQGLGSLVRFDPAVAQLPSYQSVDVKAHVTSEEGSLERYNMTASVDGQALLEESGTDPNGETLVGSVDLSDHAGSTLEVSIELEDEDGEVETVTHEYAITEAYQENQGLVPTLLTLGEGDTSGIAALIALLLTAMGVGTAATRMSTEAAGGVGVMLFGAFALINFVQVEWFFVVALAWLALTALRRPI